MTREELNAVRGYVSNIQALKDAHNTEQLPINYGTICTITANGWKLIEELKALEQEPHREIEDYENEIEDLHNRLDVAEYDKERLREEVTNLEEKIKALEQQPCEDKIIEWKKDFKEYVNALSIPRDDYKGIMEYIDELPVASQEPCEEAISRQDALDALHMCLSTNSYDDDATGDSYICYEEAEYEIEKLPSVQPKPEIKPIGYRECSDAMLKMWMDNVLTDGEYYRIMDKLNAKWGKINEVES